MNRTVLNRMLIVEVSSVAFAPTFPLRRWRPPVSPSDLLDRLFESRSNKVRIIKKVKPVPNKSEFQTLIPNTWFTEIASREKVWNVKIWEVYWIAVIIDFDHPGGLFGTVLVHQINSRGHSCGMIREFQIRTQSLLEYSLMKGTNTWKTKPNCKKSSNERYVHVCNTKPFSWNYPRVIMFFRISRSDSFGKLQHESVSS